VGRRARVQRARVAPVAQVSLRAGLARVAREARGARSSAQGALSGAGAGVIVRRFFLGQEEKTVLAGRSCSICGWRGCRHCPPLQICPAAPGEPGGARPIKVRYSSDFQQASWADVVPAPARPAQRRRPTPPRR